MKECVEGSLLSATKGLEPETTLSAVNYPAHTRSQFQPLFSEFVARLLFELR